MPEPPVSRPQCLSSEIGSEVNDSFPAALALEAAADPIHGTSSFPRSASRRVMELIRGTTGSGKPGGKGTAAGRSNTKAGLAATGETAAAAETTNKADGPRIAVPPTSPRPSASFSLRRKISGMMGLGGRSSGGGTAVLDWKPHEKILKMLGYRPRGHGRPFTESYTLQGELGRGGFGVVREGKDNLGTARSTASGGSWGRITTLLVSGHDPSQPLRNVRPLFQASQVSPSRCSSVRRVHGRRGDLRREGYSTTGCPGY